MSTPRGGRPPRLTDERRELLLNSLTAGDSIRAAAETAGLGERTVLRYLARGDAAQTIVDEHIATLTETRRRVLDRWDDTKHAAWSERRIPEPERFYWQFWREATRARARSETRALANIRRAGTTGAQVWRDVIHPKSGEVVRLYQLLPPDWRAEAWYLVHGDGRDSWYKRPQRVQVEGVEDGAPIAVADASLEAKRARVLAEIDELDARRQARDAALAQVAVDAARTDG